LPKIEPLKIEKMVVLASENLPSSQKIQNAVSRPPVQIYQKIFLLSS